MIHANRLLTDGFRNNSGLEQNLFNLKIKHKINPLSKIQFQMNYTQSPRAEDAGGITLEDSEQDWSQARQRNLDYDTYESVEHFIPEKQRELPQWARNIFTEKMLAAGNVKTDEEASEIIRIATDNLRAYFDEVGATKGEGDIALVQGSQDYYCHNQQQNPHTPNVMKSLGLNEADVDKFCTDMLFPKIV